MSVNSITARRTVPLGALMITILLVAPAAGAETFEVTTMDDGTDARKGDGFCATNQGVCTLRAAIQEANKLHGSDTVVLPPDLASFELSDGVIRVSSPVVVEGSGNQILCTNYPPRIGIEVEGDGILTMNDVRVSKCEYGLIINAGGDAVLSGVVFSDNSTGVFNRGGKLRAAGSHFLGNSSSYQYGAAIDNVDGATADLFSCELSYNSSARQGGAVHNGPASVFSAQLVAFRGNSSGRGGGAIYNEGWMTLDWVRFNENSAPEGGALENSGSVKSTVSRSTFVGNEGTSESNWDCGGAIKSTNGELHIVNSTISSNSTVGDGAGICVRGGEVHLASSTVTLNIANIDMNENGDGGGITVRDPGELETRNSIVAENYENYVGRIEVSDLAGHFFSMGFNLVGVVDERAIFNEGPGDMVGSMDDPMKADLDELRHFSWYAQYHPVLNGSAVIDSADPAGCTDPLTGDKLVTDQLEYNRNTGGACDRGAVEFQP